VQRRSFLGFLGGAVASAPTMAKTAITNMESLKFPGIVPNGLGWFDNEPSVSPSSMGIPVSSTNGWAWQSLRALKNMNPWTRKFREKTFHMNALDPNTASLRSVSLGQKMRISRRIQVEEALLLERQRLHAKIKGWIE
jgi:hypothetical protein